MLMIMIDDEVGGKEYLGSMSIDETSTPRVEGGAILDTV
jgi:hypothetical protein